MADVSKIKLENNTYDIKDSTARNRDNYSTSEYAIGKWTDDKTIYRKCYSGTISLSNGYYTLNDSTTLTNISSLIRITYIIKDGTVFISIPNNGDRICNVYLQTSYGGIGLHVLDSSYYSNFNNKDYSIIIEYTKINE